MMRKDLEGDCISLFHVNSLNMTEAAEESHGRC